MESCILMGKPNVGKTSFFLSFASYLGVSKCQLLFRGVDGGIQRQAYGMDIARKYFISSSPFKTKDVCEIHLTIPVYKGTQELKLLDTGGLMDGIHKDPHVRKSMAMSLQSMEQAKILLHVMDTSNVSSNQINSISHIDDQLNQYGRKRGGYCILANKMDLEESKEGLNQLQRRYPDTYIIPVSAVTQAGFKEVKMFVGRNI
ncbi:GTPase [Alkaliphilus hydrothermalis]|uniref:tRNA U34 5-carboxymethylaminomethyl modifying GTPase MnmE/TrmE n=1 Tax=Alkaliphilus hydrothermalis TaxID=1482730 RepID=A0ABS2NMP1_9FIRM|nr:GTPase [Alkaliphilus hydrothermalis]MBM7613839.1 tRNA U34 5-carboxymethylaminomethyl modifying GTPase MnmE/TrmE [Alkaliphilus hydrothermalis]